MSSWVPAPGLAGDWAQQAAPADDWTGSPEPAGSWAPEDAPAGVWAQAPALPGPWRDDMSDYVRRGDISGPPAIAWQKAYEYDNDGNLLFEGWARAGRLASDPFWAIKQYVYDQNGKLAGEVWADGNPYEDNVWANRWSINYS